MKKVSVIILVSFIFCVSYAHALDNPLVGMRNKIFEQAKQIKYSLAQTQDVVLVNSMWDSCIMTVSQLDAYFSLVGIFNTIKKDNITESAINYLVDWLKQIKMTAELNIKSLDAITNPLEAKTKTQMDILKRNFSDLNTRIDKELGKHSILLRSLKVKEKK
jgi:hypothetical protein